MFWLHCGLFVLVIAVPGFISSADSTSKRGNACLPACLFVYLLARFYLSLSLSICLSIPFPPSLPGLSIYLPRNYFLLVPLVVLVDRATQLRFIHRKLHISKIGEEGWLKAWPCVLGIRMASSHLSSSSSFLPSLIYARWHAIL